MSLHTLAAPAADPTVVPLPFDRPRWLAWLDEHTDPLWRPDEWAGEHWLFTGDPDESTTAIWRCNSAGCHVAVRASRHLCRSCYEQFVESGLSREEFATVGRRATVRALPGSRPHCSAEPGGIRCALEAATRGSCTPHYVKWRYEHKSGQTQLELADWLATVAGPLPPGRPCLVGACDGTAHGRRTALCTYHRERWRRHRKELGTTDASGEDLAGWASVQSPWLSGFQFTLLPLNPLLRREVLYALVQRDAQRPTLSPVAVRLLVRGLEGVDSIAALPPQQLADLGYIDRNCEAHWNDVLRLVRAAFDRFRGIDPLDKPVWELADLGLRSRTRSGVRTVPRQLDTSVIRQDWLRRLLADWVKETTPENTDFRRFFKGCSAASRALELRPGGGHDPSALKVTDMDAVVEQIRTRQREDGTGPLSAGARNELLTSFCQLLDFGRRLQIVDDLATGFARQRHHQIPYEDASEDMAGKAIPELVIAQLDAATDRIGVDFPYGDFPPKVVQAMLRTVYVLLRDTGRRPWEVRWLRIDCLDTDGGEYVLIWDNHKSRRNRRRLEISRETAFAILAWLKIRATLKIPARSRTFLFPAARHAYDACIDANTVAKMLRQWVDQLPELVTDTADEDGLPLPFDRSRIFAYAFRHTYAQRHADAGTDLHTLRDLMDHRSADTTLGYSTVSLKRRREALETMRLHVVDRSGHPMPTSSATVYDARSVGTPFGNCTEPSNVKAGGGKCPIRFQCSGCGFYRPDPSFLPAVEDHIRGLKADRESAVAMGAAAFVIRNLTDQIESFQAVVTGIRTALAEMPEAERHHIEEAAAVLRKVRAAEPPNLLPIVGLPNRSTCHG
ncbi:MULTISPECIES: site-specific integrase [unclassified Streptomyces]|uniref:tyrosine-type recombinase/integrase n=1 Tax=unclassified Streptomyces TaxID=2593676 RepID=UPI000DC77E2D|nr:MULTISPECIES: site-specific integrase [unclassified Streptomyces]AWZ06644.1 site-specific integrase [Streptomyces sp. ICC4]AWZ14371.1 site-specific integrase [Streptomyces sp. ICC1]